MTTKAGVLSAIRAKCLDCCGGSSAEVRLCGSGNCALRPLRFGRDPSPVRGAPSHPVRPIARPGRRIADAGAAVGC